MDARSEIREFLASRRARLEAADVGLPDYGARRVPGLRREEVATANPGTASADALSLLGSLAATRAAEQRAQAR
jgi:hypothetical protein